MSIEFITTLIVGLACLVGITGIVVPVLPGSMLIVGSALVWAIVLNDTLGWIGLGLIAALSAVGMTAGWVLTGRRMKSQGIPVTSLLCGAGLAIVGFFVIPFVGLIIGFVVGLYVAEWMRLSDWKQAWTSSLEALKALGLGILIEGGCAAASLTIFTVASVMYFVPALNFVS